MFHPNAHFYSKPFKIFPPKINHSKWNGQNDLKYQFQKGLKSYEIISNHLVSNFDISSIILFNYSKIKKVKDIPNIIQIKKIIYIEKEMKFNFS